MNEDPYVVRAVARLAEAKRALADAEADSSADQDRLAALRAIVGNRERQLESVKRAASL